MAIEKNTRDWPINITKITEENPARMATVTEVANHSYPFIYSEIAYATDASFPLAGSTKSVHGATPVNTCPNKMYKIVHTTNEPKIPIGISRFGFLASCAAVETASKPMKAKNTMAAPPNTPPQPCLNTPEYSATTLP